MHKPRLLGWEATNCYHVVSRTAGREFLFRDEEREVFGRMLTKTAQFCGVEVLTWCCLSNHFHLLVRVSRRYTDRLQDALRCDESAFARHLNILYTKRHVRELRDELSMLRADGHTVEADKIIESYLSRIGDLSVFVKELKQRFSIWYNQNHGRDGTLWSGRFRSVLVENSAAALRLVACYIDLNPVRAGIVTDPKEYRWCGYAQAMGGVRSAQNGLIGIIKKGDRSAERHRKPSWKTVAQEYRVILFGKALGLAPDRSSSSTPIRGRPGASLEYVKRVLTEKGKLPAHELFRLRVKHLTAGTALGSSIFLNNLVEKRSEQVSDARKSAARPLSSLDDDSVSCLRDLRV